MMSLAAVKQIKDEGISLKGVMDECVLVVSSPLIGVKFKESLNRLERNALLATSISGALKLCGEFSVSMIFVDAKHDSVCLEQLISGIKEVKVSLPLINVLVSDLDEPKIIDFLQKGADDYFVHSSSDDILRARLFANDKLITRFEKFKEFRADEKVAKSIFQKSIDYRNIKIEGMQSYNLPADIFSGDLALTSKAPNGDIYILLADFTGHGLSAAIAVLPVCYVFSNRTKKGEDTKGIIKRINEKLMFLLPTGMFMACSIVKVSVITKTISVWNAGMPDVYIVDRSKPEISTRISSTHFPLGIASLEDKDIDFSTYDMNDDDEIIMLSDGIIEVFDKEGVMFGAERLEKLIVNKNGAGDPFDNAITSYENYFAKDKPRDDVTLLRLALKGLTSEPEPHNE